MKKLPESTSPEFTRDHVIPNTYKLLSVSLVIRTMWFCSTKKRPVIKNKRLCKNNKKDGVEWHTVLIFQE